MVKAFLSDMGSECANLGLQIFGGHGYIRDNGMEQYVRDARICQIYEGTNGVQDSWSRVRALAAPCEPAQGHEGLVQRFPRTCS